MIMEITQKNYIKLLENNFIEDAEKCLEEIIIRISEKEVNKFKN